MSTELREKLDSYESILTEMMQSSRKVGVVKSNPYRDTANGLTLVRVSVGDGDQIAIIPGDILKGQTLEPGMPVQMIDGKVVGIIPDELDVKKEVPTYKLASWDDIGGLKEQIQRIRDAIELPLKNPELYTDMGMEPIKGVLLFGGPGNGKTLIAKAIAATILGGTEVEEDAFVYIKGAEILSPYVGVAENTITNTFKRCRKYHQRTNQRAIIFIDEAEAILPRRGSRRSSDVFSTIVPTFLSEMDGFDDHSPLVILSTNIPDSLDDAVIREGRIDLKIGISPPDKDAFREIVNIHLNKTKCLDDSEKMAMNITEEVFDKMPTRVSGSLAETIVKFAAQSAIRRKVKGETTKVGIIESDLMGTIDQLKITM